jgi:pre-mRNA-processing factor SLU7
MVTAHVLLGQEDERKREEKDERKRKYNVRWNDEVTFG